MAFKLRVAEQTRAEKEGRGGKGKSDARGEHASGDEAARDDNADERGDNEDEDDEDDEEEGGPPAHARTYMHMPIVIHDLRCFVGLFPVPR